MRPASDKQFAFIKSLLAERTLDEHGEAFVATARAKAVEGTLSASGASALIDWLLEQPKNGGLPKEHGNANADVTPGVYVLDGTLHLVKEGKQSGATYAMSWDTESSEWKYEGRKPLYSLTAEHRITAQQAADFGHAYGICVFCSRTLTDPRSVTVGYGPVCADYHGLPWGEVPEPDDNAAERELAEAESALVGASLGRFRDNKEYMAQFKADNE